MSRSSERFIVFFLVLLLASLACTFPQPTVTPIPTSTALLPSTPLNGTPASTEPPAATVTATLQTVTPTLTETSTSTSTATLEAVVPATQNPLGCSGYKDPSSCASAGCLWSKAGDRCRAKTNYCAAYTTQPTCAAAGCKWNKKFNNCYNPDGT